MTLAAVQCLIPRSASVLIMAFVAPFRSHPAIAPPPRARVTLLGIDDRSSGVDPVLAQIFCTMRATIGWRQEEVASFICTTNDVVESLEAGRMKALPAWPETMRLIAAYGKLVDADIRPVLDRLQQQGPFRVPIERQTPLGGRQQMPGPVERTPRTAPPSSRATGPTMAPPSVPARWARVPRPPRLALPAGLARRLTAKTFRLTGVAPRRITRGMAMIALATLLAVGTIAALTALPTALNAAADQLPPELAKSIRSGLDRLKVSLAPFRESLKWIDVADPRSRKGDRLATPAER